ANNYYLVTVTKSPGVVSTSNTKIYIGSALQTTTRIGTSDGQSPNLASNLKLRLNCASFGVDSTCQTGSGTVLGGTYSYLAIYNRALSADEVAHNYAALKADMAQAPRSITLQ